MGPMPKEKLLNYGLNPNSNVWAQGFPSWLPAYQVPDLMNLLNSRATPPPFNNRPHAVYSSNPAEIATTDKSKIVAGVLAILLGGLGVQYFYCGKISGGFITLLLSIITFGIWSVLTFIQGIMMLCMTQQEFEQKYVLSQSTLPLF